MNKKQKRDQKGLPRKPGKPDGGNTYFFRAWVDWSKLTKDIAPEPISSINPIVKTIKNIIPIVKPKVETWYNETAKGNNNKISRSKIRNNKATIIKWIWNVDLVWPGIGAKPHSYWLTLAKSGLCGANKIFKPNKTAAKIGVKININNKWIL